jgi:hypothetical protein
MITELKSIPDIWKRMPSEMHDTKLDLRLWICAMFLLKAGLAFM